MTSLRGSHGIGGPKITNYDRSLGVFDFEGGGFVQIIVGGPVSTAEALATAETLIGLKRAELKQLAEKTVCGGSSAPADDAAGSDDA